MDKYFQDSYSQLIGRKKNLTHFNHGNTNKGIPAWHSLTERIVQHWLLLLFTQWHHKVAYKRANHELTYTHQ